MPPKRRQPVSTSTATTKPRQSKLAKENNISATVEAEFREAFSLFSVPDPSISPSSTTKETFVLPTPSLRRALTALGTPPSSASELRELLDAVDSDDSGAIRYENFVAIAALKWHARTEGQGREEVREAFRLFLGKGGKGKGVDRGGEDAEEKITLGMLRRVARELKEDVSEQVLKDMILEANGGGGVGQGVGLGEFEGVMRRAGVFS